MILAAFRQQAVWCRQLGSPLTGLLMDVLAERLDHSTAVGRRVLDWPGRPAAGNDAVPLRLAGGLHALMAPGWSGRPDDGFDGTLNNLSGIHRRQESGRPSTQGVLLLRRHLRPGSDRHRHARIGSEPVGMAGDEVPV